MTQKKVVRILPLSMKSVGEKLAEIHCRNMGLPENTDDYADEFDDYFFGFNHEAFELSMTPSGHIGRNPATPKVQENYFNLASDIFGKNGYIENLSVDDSTKEKYRRMLRGNIIALVHFIMESRYGAQIKRKNGKDSDFEFSKDANTPAQEDVIFNQYARLYFTMKLVSAIAPLITKFDEGYAEYFDKALGSDWRDKGIDFLRKKETREAYATAIYNDLNKKSKMVMQNPVRKENPSHPTFKGKSGFVFSEEEKIYFDEEKLKKALRELETVEMTPSENYISKKTCTPEQIKKADMSIPAICGSKAVSGGLAHFLISGEAQILKALENGLPVIDFLVLDPAQTLSCMVVTKNTREKYERMKNGLQRQSKKFKI